VVRATAPTEDLRIPKPGRLALWGLGNPRLRQSVLRKEPDKFTWEGLLRQYCGICGGGGCGNINSMKSAILSFCANLKDVLGSNPEVDKARLMV
jgi:hypothetical protein